MFQCIVPNVPQYCQYDANYCGAASAQMILNSYPNPNPVTAQDQIDIYSWIMTNQTEAAPYKTPDMVRGAIHHFNPPPPPDHFVANAFSDDEQAMYTILYWIRKTNYPAGTMIGGNHWVVITGFETDLDPQGHSNIDLNWIEFNDPLPFCG
jgi:hypothetical protein